MLLLAEALTAGTSVGRALDLLRLCERAFRLTPGKLAGPLTTFLSVWTNEPFSRAEVKQWTNRARPAAHADKHDDFATGHDLAHLLRRLEFAAYDVLFNKARWRNTLAARRGGLQLMALPKRDGGLVLMRPSAEIRFMWRDPYNTWPTQFGLRIHPPDNTLDDLASQD